MYRNWWRSVPYSGEIRLVAWSNKGIWQGDFYTLMEAVNKINEMLKDEEKYGIIHRITVFNVEGKPILNIYRQSGLMRIALSNVPQHILDKLNI